LDFNQFAVATSEERFNHVKLTSVGGVFPESTNASSICKSLTLPPQCHCDILIEGSFTQFHYKVLFSAGYNCPWLESILGWGPGAMDGTAYATTKFCDDIKSLMVVNTTNNSIVCAIFIDKVAAFPRTFYETPVNRMGDSHGKFIQYLASARGPLKQKFTF